MKRESVGKIWYWEGKNGGHKKKKQVYDVRSNPSQRALPTKNAGMQEEEGPDTLKVRRGLHPSFTA